MDAGTRLGVYEIVGPLGKGGMGEVYRALDTRLQREVALKTLPADLAADPERLARLEREAQVLASLNHPNIAAVHGLEDADGVRYLVMELAPGESLADRLAPGPVPIEAALGIALQVAEALEAAHERGIVHRDLKPANVQVGTAGAHEGQVKVLDFGLAKGYGPGAGSGSSLDLTTSPTVAATQTGVLLGTAGYMSPEQARAKPVDKRTDIWAFGCVLFECLTGRRAFAGETVTDVLAALIHKEPDWDLLPPATPWRVRDLLERALCKDPSRRMRDIGEARIAIQRYLADPGAEPTVGTEQRSSGVSWPAAIAGGVALAVIAGLLGWSARSAPAPDPTFLRRFDLGVGEIDVFDREPKLSPDGRRVVFSRDGQLWIRDLERLDSLSLAGTERAEFPFWSPDSREVAFFADDTLWRIDVGSGSRQAILGGLGGFEGGSWGADGSIVFGSDPELSVVPAAGGDPRVLIEPQDGEIDFHDPAHLPNGSIVFVAHRFTTSYAISVWDGVERRTLVESGAGDSLRFPSYSRSGLLLYTRSMMANSGVWAVGFDAASARVSGDPFPLELGGGAPSLGGGALAFVRDFDVDERGEHRAILVDRSGNVLGVVGRPAQSGQPALEPGGDRVVLAQGGGALEIWIHDTRGGSRRVSPAGFTYAVEPVWLPNGEILFVRSNDSTIMRMSLDDPGSVREVARGEDPSVTADGRFLVFTRTGDGEDNTDIWYLDMEAGGEPRRFRASPEPELSPALSPDGRLLAFTVAELGVTSEVFVAGFPDGSGMTPVSIDGGQDPRWTSGGAEIVFRPPGGTSPEALAIWSARLESTDPPVFSVPERLFGHSEILAEGNRLNLPRGYDVAPDGQTFVVLARPADTRASASVVLVQNWEAQLDERR